MIVEAPLWEKGIHGVGACFYILSPSISNDIDGITWSRFAIEILKIRFTPPIFNVVRILACNLKVAIFDAGGRGRRDGFTR
jgi:hypothetical protein